MLDILKRGTAQTGGYTWEYHGDTASATIFYITPQPVWLIDQNLPKIQLVTYKTSDSLNGSGYCNLQVQLGVSQAGIDAVTADIVTRFKVQPTFLTLPFQSGTLVNITYPDGLGGTTGLQANGSDFGSNGAIFQIPLSVDQVKTFIATLAKPGGSPFEVQYNILVPAQMPAVTMDLSFDSSIAFDYEVTSHEHTHWASSSTYTYDINEQLTSSGASKVTITKVDPNLPADVITNLNNWGQTVISNLLAQEVQQAIALQQGASGTQSFSISEVSSFSETYQQNEVILWRLQPQSILPSFADLGLTVAQIESLEVTVDVRQFSAQVTPQCLFVGSKPLHSLFAANPTPDPFMSNIKPLTKLDVTISYPGIDAGQTHTFTDNTPFSWQSAWDDNAQGNYSLSYVATYQDNTQVKGSTGWLSASDYTLTLADIGTLNVIFDASRFFTTTGSIVNQVTVDFVFNIPQQSPFLQSAVLTAANPQAVFSSVFPTALTTDYLYTVTYGFVPTAKANPYTSDAKQQNGQWVRLQTPDFQQSFNVGVNIGTTAGSKVQAATVNFFYDGKPYFPNIPASQQLPQPTDSSPIQLNFPLASSSAALQLTPITFFANTKITPLTVNATLITDSPTAPMVQIGPYQFNPQSVTLLYMTSSIGYAFIEVDPTIVDWNPKGGSPLQGITVHITKITYTEPGTTGAYADATKTANPPAVQSITWNAAENLANSVFFPVLNLPTDFQNLSFNWYAEYIYTSGVLYTSGTEDATTLSLPPVAKDAAPPAPKTDAPARRPVFLRALNVV